MRLRGPIFYALAALLPTDAALAHAPLEGGGSFSGGVLHPLFVPAHVLAILGTGLLAGQRSPHRHWLVPASYVAGLAAGFAIMAFAFTPISTLEALLAVTAASGVLVALARPLPWTLECTLALVTGSTLALDSVPDVLWLDGANVELYGTFCGAAVLLLAVTEVASMFRREWQRLCMRVFGSWIAASAIMVLTLQVAR